MIRHEWEDAAGTEWTALDVWAAGEVAGYTETIRGKLTQPGRARQIVERAQRRAAAQGWEAVADYTVRPLQAATITPTGETGTVESVTWSWPESRMSVQLTDTI